MILNSKTQIGFNGQLGYDDFAKWILTFNQDQWNDFQP